MVVAFTGHREYDAELVGATLYRRVAEIASCGDVTFLSGMAVGFDLAAAEAVLAARRSGYNVELKCIVPFLAQPHSFSYEDKMRYDEVMELADEVVVLSDEYRSDVFFRRNDFLVDNADTIIAYYNSQKKGGTAYTVRRARKANIEVENLYPEQQLSLF